MCRLRRGDVGGVLASGSGRRRACPDRHRQGHEPGNRPIRHTPSIGNTVPPGRTAAAVVALPHGRAGAGADRPQRWRVRGALAGTRIGSRGARCGGLRVVSKREDENRTPGAHGVGTSIRSGGAGAPVGDVEEWLNGRGRLSSCKNYSAWAIRSTPESRVRFRAQRSDRTVFVCDSVGPVEWPISSAGSP